MEKMPGTYFKNKLFLNVFGIAIGAFLFSMWLQFFFLLCLVIIIYNNSFVLHEDKSLITKIFLIGLISRLIVGSILHVVAVLYGNGIDIFGDGMAYALNGRWISGIIDGSAVNLPILYDSPPIWEVVKGTPRELWGGLKPCFIDYQITLWAYILGILYHAFGFQPLIGIMLNCLLGALLPINLYFITSRLTNLKEINYYLKVAALTIFSFFPSLFLWSITNSRDMSIIYLLSCFVLLILKYEKKDLVLLIAALPVAIIIGFFRIQLLYPLIFLLLFIISLKRFCLGIVTRKITSIAIIGCLTVIFFQNRHGIDFGQILESFFIDQIITIQKGTISTGGNIYYILPRHYYSAIASLHLTFFDYSLLILKGWFHMLLEPLPCRVTTLSSLLSYPQMVIWYVLIFFSIYGMFLSIRIKKNACMLVVLYIFIFGTIIALYGGNAGTTFRLRDLVTPFMLIFSIIGFNKILTKPE